MQKRTLFKILAALWIIIFVVFYLIGVHISSLKICSEFFNTECERYIYSLELCVCYGSEFKLNNSLIEERNTQALRQSYRGTPLPEINYTQLEGVIIKVNRSGG